MREDLRDLFKGTLRSGIRRVTVTLEHKGENKKRGLVFHVHFNDDSLLHVGEDLTSTQTLETPRDIPTTIRTRRTTRRS